MTNAPLLTTEEVALAKKRRLEAMRLQEIESNPLTPEEVEMFEMFERERWPHDKRRQYILASVENLHSDAAE